jgi:beta-phosphoglucomutase-like phosphatase (HAD superfamily)
MIKTAFFDLDETLIDAEKAHKTATSKAFAYFGYDYAEVRKKSSNHTSMGKRVYDNLKIRRDAAGISEKEIPMEKLREVREAYFLDLVKIDSILLKGSHEIFTIMKEKNILTAIVSSGTKKYINLMLDIFKLQNYVDFVIGGDDVVEGKPNPECYLKAYEHALQSIPNLQTEECLVFEDTEAGVTAGKNAGMKVVLIPTSYSIMPTEILADYKIDSLLEFDKTILS